MAALATVQDYVTSARVLLQDTVAPYRFSDAQLLVALNLAILEARRIRPDLFLSSFDAIPSYSAVDTTAVAVDLQYRPAVLYFIVGYTEFTNAEETSDQRGSALIDRFTSQLVGVR